MHAILRCACLAALLACGSVPAAAQNIAPCRVADPELQGEYAGPCVDGLAQGHGMAKGTARYTGGFVAGRKHGIGVKEWPNGDRYEGEFNADRKHGFGSYSWGGGSEWAGQRYSGAYAEDRRHGAGVYTWPDGRQLAAQWKQDRPSPPLPPAMQATVRAHAERMVALIQPGRKVCREVQVGTVQRDTVIGVVQASVGERVRIRIERVGQFSRQLDGRTIAVGDEVLVYPDHWFSCL